MSKKKYDVRFASERAEKEFFKVLSIIPQKEQARIIEWFDKLAENPRPLGKTFKTLKGELSMFNYMAHYRIREGDWRILYDIDETNSRVILLAIRRRAKAYE